MDSRSGKPVGADHVVADGAVEAGADYVRHVCTPVGLSYSASNHSASSAAHRGPTSW